MYGHLGYCPILWFWRIFISRNVRTCLTIWVGHTYSVIFVGLLLAIPFTIIIITTVWTYLFTRNFLKKDYRHRQAMSKNIEDQLHEKSVYSVRIRNIIGIFGMLLLFNVMYYSLYTIAIVIGLIIGLENIPAAIYTAVLILFLFNNVTNSVIQSYFRRDLHNAITTRLRMIASLMKKLCERKQLASATRDDKRSVELKNTTLKTQGCDSKGHSETAQISFESQSTMCIQPVAMDVNVIHS